MQTHESIGRDLLRLMVWYPLRWFILLMPARTGMGVLRLMGDLHFAVARSGRAMVANNLTRGMGCKENEQDIVRKYYRNHYLDQLFPMIFPRFSPDTIDQYVEIRGKGTLDNALAKGKGVVLVHGHFGPVHLPLVVLALKGYPMKQVGNPSDEGLSWIGRRVAFRLRMKYEGKIPARIIKTGSFLRPVFQALHANQVVMITGDGSGRREMLGKQVEISFLGHPVQFPMGPALLATKTGAPLVPLFIVPGGNRPFTIIIREEISTTVSGEQAAVEWTGIFAEQLQEHIMDNPGYWHFWDRFSPGRLIEERNRDV